jgi:hypothetical protein
MRLFWVGMHPSRRWIIGFALVAFIVARLTGAHLHMCFDGSEPLAQLHVSDTAGVDHHADESDHHHIASVDHPSVATQAHEDVDVDMLGSMLAKNAKFDLPVIALAAWCLAFFYVAVVRQPVPTNVRQPPRRPPRYLRPLLRGPPV